MKVLGVLESWALVLDAHLDRQQSETPRREALQRSRVNIASSASLLSGRPAKKLTAVSESTSPTHIYDNLSRRPLSFTGQSYFLFLVRISRADPHIHGVGNPSNARLPPVWGCLHYLRSSDQICPIIKTIHSGCRNELITCIWQPIRLGSRRRPAVGC